MEPDARGPLRRTVTFKGRLGRFHVDLSGVDEAQHGQYQKPQMTQKGPPAKELISSSGSHEPWSKLVIRRLHKDYPESLSRDTRLPIRSFDHGSHPCFPEDP